MDHLSKDRRSENMRAIRGQDTGPEMVVRRLLHKLGYRYRLHRKDLPGKPDLVFPGRRAVVFVHGCFWHQHSSANCKARPPKSNKAYWSQKLKRNIERDTKNRNALEAAGWRVKIVWECEVKDTDKLTGNLVKFLQEN